VLFTLLSGAFWPYSPKSESRFAKHGYPDVLGVLRKEAESVKKTIASHHRATTF
jgi:hypothetical protein